jgi:hypothetical protein
VIYLKSRYKNWIICFLSWFFMNGQTLETARKESFIAPCGKFQMLPTPSAGGKTQMADEQRCTRLGEDAAEASQKPRTDRNKRLPVGAVILEKTGWVRMKTIS